MDALQTFKETQKQMWPSFAPLEIMTTAPAAQLVKHSRVRSGQRVLDVACGTGVVSITAARLGCKVTGLDLTPELLEHARENAKIGGFAIDFHEGDVEDLPFPDASYDAVLSQFGHMFAPRPAVALGEMLRVLKPGGTIAFSTWPPEMIIGRRFKLMSGYTQPPPLEIPSPSEWGNPAIVLERLGASVKDVVFDRGRLQVPALSPAHYAADMEKNSPSIAKAAEKLAATDPDKLVRMRAEVLALAAEYFEDNIVRQDFLMTRATKL
ncbi:MAG TPA: methyltransferase domain-containing protein [Candidatus Eisenbacteria bacterium]|nr:methyltransferase domain-containing protein [Candidatus Eisenbacteria bacterium]